MSKKKITKPAYKAKKNTAEELQVTSVKELKFTINNRDSFLINESNVYVIMEFIGSTISKDREHLYVEHNGEGDNAIKFHRFELSDEEILVKAKEWILNAVR